MPGSGTIARMDEKPETVPIVVLNDFATYTDRTNCTVRFVPAELSDDPNKIEDAIRGAALEWEPVITTRDVIDIAEEILDDHPDFVEAYQLLADTLFDAALERFMQQPEPRSDYEV